MLILRPIPSLILGESNKETLQPNIQVNDFAAWFSGLLAHAPAAYNDIYAHLKQVMPDLKDIKNPATGTDWRSLVVQFSNDLGTLNLPFGDLSDGEKCFMICAVVLAANNAYGPLLCFWDEPDNYLALDEVGDFVVALRRAFQSGGQFIATSHNDEAIPRFSDENTFLLHRRNHLEPTIVRPVSELQIHGDLVSALARGDVEPNAATVPGEAIDPFPNKIKYEDGSVLNMPISHYENRTEAKIKQDLIDAKNEPEVIEPHMDLIREALTFYGTKFADESKKPEPT